MDGLYLPEPTAYNGSHQESHFALQIDIRKKFPDYDKNDPRTWPCIDKMRPDILQHGKITNSVLPSLAFGQDCMNEMMRNKKISSFDTKATNNTFIWDYKPMKKRFRCFPYNFSPDGQLRQKVCIPKADFEEWMHGVNGPKWRLKNSVETTWSGESPDEATIDEADSFQRIMRGLNEQKAACDANLDVKRELQNAASENQRLSRVAMGLAVVVSNRAQALEGTERHAATVATRQKEALQKDKEKTSEILYERIHQLQGKMLQASEKVRAAEAARDEQIKTCQAALDDLAKCKEAKKASEAALQTALQNTPQARQNALKEANDRADKLQARIDKIWAEMESTRKRKAESDLAREASAKRKRTE